MEVRLAKSAGFCKGVKRAMEKVLEVAEKDQGEVCTLGPLIHNPQTVRFLESRGVKAIGSLEEGNNSTIVIRSHGVPPGVRGRLKKERRRYVDATCPDVGRIQALIKKHAREGYFILIVGDKGHAEVEGLKGYAGDRVLVISSDEDLADLPEADRVCLVAQSTQMEDYFLKVAGEVRKRYPVCEVFNTICESTTRRQSEVAELSREVDAVVVVGGKNSANTKRLAEIARNAEVPTFHIESEEEIAPEEFRRFRSVGVTAGGSTPNWTILRVVDRLRKIEKADGIGLWGGFRSLFSHFVYANLYLALGGAFACYAGASVEGAVPSAAVMLIAFLYIFSMHTINRTFYADDAFRLNEPQRRSLFERYRPVLMAASFVSVFVALVLAGVMGWRPFLLMLALGIGGLLYKIKVVPKRFSRYTRYRSIKEIPGSKDFLTAIAWGTFSAILPALAAGDLPAAGAIPAFMLVFAITFSRSILIGVRDMRGDRMVGRETLPILFGKKKTKLILSGMLALAGLVLVYFASQGIIGGLGYLLLFPLLYAGIYLLLFHWRVLHEGLLLEIVVDANFIICGLLALFYNRFSS